jgi:hypothetical protein
VLLRHRSSVISITYLTSVAFFVRPKKVTKETASRGSYPLENPCFSIALSRPTWCVVLNQSCGVTECKLVARNTAGLIKRHSNKQGAALGGAKMDAGIHKGRSAPYAWLLWLLSFHDERK